MASTTNVTKFWLRQKKVQPQDLEVLRWCLQRHARHGFGWLKNLMHARRTLPRPPWLSRTHEHQTTHWDTRSRHALRYPLVRPRPKPQRLGLELKRHQLHLRRRCRLDSLSKIRHWFNLPGPSSGLRRLRVQLETQIGDHLHCSKLLRLILKQRRLHEHRPKLDLFFPHSPCHQKNEMTLVSTQWSFKINQNNTHISYVFLSLQMPHVLSFEPVMIVSPS